MNCSPNYTEWSREEKEELAKRRMDEMKLKNEKLLQRHAEVENDRINAESRNSAITGAVKAVKKEKNVNVVECSKEETKVEHAREWDRGKPDKDHWQSPEHHGSSFKNYRSGRNRKDDRKDNWGNFSRNENTDRSRLNRGTDGRHEVKDNYNADGNWGQNSNKLYSKPYKPVHMEEPYEKRNADKKDTWSGYPRNESNDHASESRKQRGGYRYKNDNTHHGTSRVQMSPKRTRGVGYRNSDSHRKLQNSFSDDKFKRTDYNRSNSRKKFSYRAHSRSTSRSGSDRAENQFTIRAYNLWHNDQISEDQTKQNRVEKWVKSVNKTNMWGGKPVSSDQKEKNSIQFAPEQKEKNIAKVSPEQKDKHTTRSFTKFDRLENNSNKSSDEEYVADFGISRGNKTCENSNYTSQRDYNEIRNQNKGTTYNFGSAQQMGGLKKKGVQTKRSPQYSSGSSTRNENFRKQRRFDGKGQKNDEDRNRYNVVIAKNSTFASWKNSTFDSTRNKTNSGDKYSKLDNADTWNQEDKGIWSNADQSHIKWKISDDENNGTETKNQDIKQEKKNIDTGDTWRDNHITANANKSRLKEQQREKEVPPDNDDGMWSNVDQSDIFWKAETETYSQEVKNDSWEVDNSDCTVKSPVQKAIMTEPRDGCEGYETQHENQHNVKRSSEGKELKISEQKISDSGTKKTNVSDCQSSSATRQQSLDAPKSHCDEDTIISSFKRSVCISDDVNVNVSVDYFPEKPIASDDGGWSTVSEEGEVHSEDENENENKKL